MSKEDLLLFKNIKSNNQQAFDTLFRKYYVQLARFSFKFLRDKELAEEVVQETFIYLWNKRQKIKITTSVKAFLYTSVKNRTINHLKSAKTRKDYEKSYFEEYIEYLNQEKEKPDEKELQVKIKKAAGLLPEKCREIFCLSKFEGLSYDEIAVYLNISKKTIENQMTIAFKKLRENLKDDF